MLYEESHFFPFRFEKNIYRFRLDYIRFSLIENQSLLTVSQRSQKQSHKLEEQLFQNTQTKKIREK